MKNILLIHHRLPYPLSNGMDKLRYNLLINLSKRYKVTLAVPVDENTKPEWIERFSHYTEELITVPVLSNEAKIKKSKLLYFLRFLKLIAFREPYYSSENYYQEFKKRLVKLTEEKQFYFIQTLSDFSACYLKYLPQKVYKITGPMDDTIELTRQNFLIEKLKIPKISLWFLHRSMKRYFTIICKRSELVLFHSIQDLNRVKSILGFDFNALILPVATDQIEKAEEQFPYPEPDSLIFVGGLGASFNQDAVWHLVDDILPVIRLKIPGVKLYLVGNHPSKSILALGENPNIIVTGEVPDVKPFIKKAAVFISPVRIGTGIKTKVIEALSMSKAMVVSTASLQGLWEWDKTMFVCDDNNDFAEKVLSLLQNSELRTQHEKKSSSLFNSAFAFPVAELLTLSSYLEFEKNMKDIS